MSPSHIPALARQTILTPLERLGRAEFIAQRLAEAIQMGVFVEGEQLPSEAELAAQLAVAPVTLREALAALRDRGLVRTRRGRGGGTFVSATPELTAAHLRRRLLRRSLDDLRDLGDVHVAVAGTAAWLAAQRASSADVARLRDRLDALVEAGDAGDCLRMGVRFHIEIAAISRSVRLTNEEMALQVELAPLMRLVLEEHDEVSPGHAAEQKIFRAIERGDARRSRDLAASCAAHAHGRLVAWHMRLSAADWSAKDDGISLEPAEAMEQVTDLVDGVFERLIEARELLLEQQARARRDARALLRSDLEPVRRVVLRQLHEQRDLVSGAGPVFARGVLGDAPLWLDWWCSVPDREPRFLVVNLDPNSPEFYDYSSAEWFAGPRATGERAVVGPLVDYSGTDAHNLTVAIPAIDRDGAFLGVVGADLPLGQLETTAAPILRRVRHMAVLVNQHGRVLASTDPRHIPGALIAAQRITVNGGFADAPTGFELYRSARLPWALLVVVSPTVAVA